MNATRKQTKLEELRIEKSYFEMQIKSENFNEAHKQEAEKQLKNIKARIEYTNAL